MKFLVVVDVQRDFVDLALANPEAQKRIPNIIEKVKAAREAGNEIIFTQDTHEDNYMNTLEGKKLPIPHCIEGSEGWEIVPEVLEVAGENYYISHKFTFGSIYLPSEMKCDENDEIEIIGFVSSICVISNALLLRAHYPNLPITIDASCCAGLTKEDHDAAMIVAQSCQIDVINWER